MKSAIISGFRMMISIASKPGVEMDKRASEDEARRALNRLEAESEKLLGGAQDNRAEDDRMEILGKRIARILSYGLAAGLLYYLWTLL
jgi:hypothetical protein